MSEIPADAITIHAQCPHCQCEIVLWARLEHVEKLVAVIVPCKPEPARPERS